MSAFTKGPYRVFVDDQDCVLVYGHDEHDGNFTICRMEPWGYQLRAETMATANLFKASPDMYEALSIICDYLEMDGRGDAMLMIGKAALAKARGE